MPGHRTGTREEWQAARAELAKLEAEHPVGFGRQVVPKSSGWPLLLEASRATRRSVSSTSAPLPSAAEGSEKLTHLGVVRDSKPLAEPGSSPMHYLLDAAGARTRARQRWFAEAEGIEPTQRLAAPHRF